MDIYVYGAGNQGEKIIEAARKYDDINILCFVDSYKEEFLQGIPIKRLEDLDVRKDIPIVISIGKLYIAKSVYDILKEHAFEKIFWYSPKDHVYQKENFLLEQCIECSLWEGSRVLPQVEMHIIDSCNLNCRGCSHFSPIFSKELPDMQKRLEDVQKLKEKFDHIIRFYILGGEPFLNPELGKYVLEIHKLLPHTEIVVVTNGLLICKVDTEILRMIQMAGAIVSISEYTPTSKILDDVVNVLEQNCVLYEIRRATIKQSFNIPLSLDGNSKREKCCISDGCITIWNGKITKCPTLMYIEKFNEVFGTHLPSEGIYNLEECPEGEKLVKLLDRKVPLCAHCVLNEAEWAVCGKNPRLEDFAALD